MIKSNSPVIPISMYKNKPQLKESLSQNMATIDNIKVREQFRGMQNAQAFGNAKAVTNQSLNLHLSQKPKNKNKVPLVRKRTAREYATE